jgi:hypothetical protein
VQEATRDTGDDLLITTDTWKLLSHEFEAESRGHVELKGVPEPVALHAPAIVATEEAAPEEVAVDDEEAAATPAGATFTTLRSRLRDRLGR